MDLGLKERAAVPVTVPADDVPGELAHGQLHPETHACRSGERRSHSPLVLSNEEKKGDGE